MSYGQWSKGCKPGGIIGGYRLAKTSTSWRRASRCTLSMGAMGDTRAGRRRAAVKSWAATIARSSDETICITRVDGNQARVSEMHSTLISHTHKQ